MNVQHLSVKNFRNIENIEINPCDEINIIYGENAQGKTNLLESIWLFTACRSFRSSKDKELINFNSKKALLSMDFFAEERDQYAEIEIGEKRNFILNTNKLCVYV